MFYRVMRCIAKLLITVPHRINYEGLENIPKDGAVMLVANHQQAYDPLLLGLATQREVVFIAKEELFKGKFLTWFFKKLHVIALDREGVDRKAIKEAINVLKSGGVLGVFPEGTRSKTGDLLPFKTGACFIASQAPCEIVPIGIHYDDGLLNYFGKPVTVRVGKSFPYEGKEGEKRKETQERMLEKQEKAVYDLVFPESKNIV
ncbi:MAG: lysophospholipid acyltransferase family protein [Clostridiales bacterium]